MRGPAFESINVIPIVNDSAAETALRAGDIDFTEIATGSVDRLKADSRFQSISRNTLDYQFLAMNVTDELLKDPNLRQAIRSAIDVPGIIEAAYDGKWTRANAIIPKNMGLGYWKGAPVYQRDVDKAKAFLAKTGKSNITLTLATQDDEADKTVVQVIQANLKDIGITTELRITDPATFNAIPGAGGGGKNRQLVYGGYVSRARPVVVDRLVHVCPERPLELGQLVRQGWLRPPALRGHQGDESGQAPEAVRAAAEALGCRVEHGLGRLSDALLRRSQGPDAGAPPGRAPDPLRLPRGLMR